MAQLICKDLTLGYDSKPVLSGLSFEVSSGDYLYVVGENGSGKTTLMKTVLGLMSPLSGTVTYGDGVSANKIGYLPQQTVVQRDFPASVREIVLTGTLSGGRFSPFYSKAQKALAEKNMERLNIKNIASRCYRELSGGQQQRVLLARALCSAEKMLLLDEPVSGLDPLVAEETYETVAALNKELGVTVIMISHDLSAAVKYATHILHIGEPLYFGSKEDYLEKDPGELFGKGGNC